jgi:MSHA biogenesis protein MshJ
MKAWWSAQAERINHLSLRERAFLFLSVLAICVVLGERVWIAPAQQAHQQVLERYQKQTAELRRLRDEVKRLGQPVDTAKASRDQLAILQDRLGVVNDSIQGSLPTANGGVPLAQTLVHLLRRHDGLNLVRTASLAPEAPAAVNAKAGASAKPLALTRVGVELTVAGAYPDLTRYVQTLEQALPYVRWGPMTLKSEKQAPELTLQLFLLGVAP